jgi:hypothetical protein
MHADPEGNPPVPFAARRPRRPLIRRRARSHVRGGVTKVRYGLPDARGRERRNDLLQGTHQSPRPKEDIVTKLKMLVVTAIATLAIGAGGLAAAPSASAAVVSCEQAQAVAEFYNSLAVVEQMHGNPTAAVAWVERAVAVVLRYC